MPDSPNLLSAEKPPIPETEPKLSEAQAEELAIKQTPETEQKEHIPQKKESEKKSSQESEQPVDKQLLEIKKVLVSELNAFTNPMNPQEKERFDKTENETALFIQEAVNSGKPVYRQVVGKISEWLSLIPEVNKFWIQQEAKTRADRVISEHERETQGPSIFGILLAQADIFNTETNKVISLSTSDSDILSQFFFVIILALICVGVLIGFVFFLRWFLRKHHEFSPSSRLVTLLLTVPKEQQLKDKAGDATIEQIRAQIAVSESFLSTIGGLRAERGFAAWFFGRTDQMGFEIVAKNGLIYFYVAVPIKYRFIVEQQMQAQYPSIQIDEVDDYNFFKPKDVVVGAYMRYTKTYAYPFKTYQHTDSDPINGLLNPMTKVGDHAGVAIQYVVRSAKDKWRRELKKHGKLLAEGKKSKDIITIIGNMAKLASGQDPKKTEESKTHQPTPLEQELIKKIDEKQSKGGMDCNIRIIVSAQTQNNASTILKNIISAFSQYNLYQFGNSFKAEVHSKPEKLINDFIFRNFNEKKNCLMNTEELASLWHMPLPFTEIPNIKWLTSRTSAPPEDVPQEGMILGYNMYRRKKTEIRITRDDRRRHMYIIGMTGTGKSTLLSNQASQDIKNGEGCCVMDPHGELAIKVLGTVPPERIDDVVYLNPADTGRPIGLNMLEFDETKPEQKTFVINEFIAILDRLYNLKETGGPMFESYLRNSILLNMAHPESGNTIMEISKVLADEDFRKFKLSKCANKPVVDFWVKEAEKAGGEAALANMVPYITSKLNQFIGNDIMRPIIAQQKSAINFRDIMDNQKILLVNLSKGKLGDMNSNLIGMIVIGKILMSALGRTDIPNEDDRKDFYLYLDEFQNFLTDSIEAILSEARKYRLILNIAHQYIGQLDEMESIKAAIFGNVGSKVCFRIGVDDAEFLAKEYTPVFSENDLLNIDKRQAYVKLMIDLKASRPFNMATYPPPNSDDEIRNALIEISRLTFGRDREIVEREIRQRAID